MKLELTVNEKVMNNMFSDDPEDFKVKERLSKHKIISSDELKEIWLEEAKSKGYEKRLMSWLFKKISSRENFEKVKANNIDSIVGTDDFKEKVLVSTAKESNDKIVVGVNKSTLKNKYRELKFISESQINAEKKQEITISDIENVLNKSKIDKLFDIYETSIIIKVSKNQDAKILAEYLSKFYKDSNNIIIKDAYLDDNKNKKNLNEYVLPYLNKDTCIIKFILANKQSKSQFENYRGYNTSVSICSRDEDHISYIETERYTIVLGYRLLTFGIGGKISKEDIIAIRKKD